MMRVTTLLIFMVYICEFTFAQHNTKPTTFLTDESFEFVLRDVITFINDNEFENLDENLKIKFDSIYSYENFDSNKFKSNDITIPISLKNNKIEVLSKHTIDFYPPDIRVELKRKKTIKTLPPPIWEMPTQHYQSNWLINIKKMSNGSTQVTISFEGVSNDMKIEIENYIKEKASDGFNIKKFKSTNKLEAELVNKIKKNNKKSYFPKEIGPNN